MNYEQDKNCSSFWRDESMTRDESIFIEKGFYVLNQDVVNPRPDRRSKMLHSVPVWKQGLRVHIVPFEEGRRRGSINFHDGSMVNFGGSDPEVDLGNHLVPHLEKAPYAIGQTFRDPFVVAQMDDVLALAYERKLLTNEQIVEMIAVFDAMNDTAYMAFKKKHWLPRT